MIESDIGVELPDGTIIPDETEAFLEERDPVWRRPDPVVESSAVPVQEVHIAPHIDTVVVGDEYTEIIPEYDENGRIARITKKRIHE